MGTLVVNCTNRPPTEIIDCGTYGMRENMHSYDVDYVDGELVLGLPLEEGVKLPYHKPPAEATTTKKSSDKSDDKATTEEGGES